MISIPILKCGGRKSSICHKKKMGNCSSNCCKEEEETPQNRFSQQYFFFSLSRFCVELKEREKKREMFVRGQKVRKTLRFHNKVLLSMWSRKILTKC